jgi:hypothetical protein
MADTVEITLTQGQRAIVDFRFAHLAALKWCAMRDRYGRKFYAVRPVVTGGKKGLMYMHRVVLEGHLGRALGRREQVDHANGDALDNRLCNLRVATTAQNMWNRGPPKHNTSGAKGVTWDRSRGRWMATIQANGRRRSLGRFVDKERAVAAYTRAATEIHGEFAMIPPARTR